MSFCEKLKPRLNLLHLLNHPFYQAWNSGTLNIDTLQIYAKEYYAHVAAFPRYISSIHALCPDLKTRQILLGNLIEEESGEENHPELWLRFAEGLGVRREHCQAPADLPTTRRLVEEYFSLARSSYAEGLGALYAYERQTPEVSKSKIEGLRKHYGCDEARSLQFFNVHITADEWHREEIEGLIENLPPENQSLAAQGAQTGAELLWSFLDGILEKADAH